MAHTRGLNTSVSQDANDDSNKGNIRIQTLNNKPETDQGPADSGKSGQGSDGQIVIEGGVADDLNIAEAIKEAIGITYSGDSTTIHGIAHESRTININGNQRNEARFSLGVHSAVNRTTTTQLTGLPSQLNGIFKTYNAFKKSDPEIDSCLFAKKLTGAITDHAADQKKLIKRILLKDSGHKLWENLPADTQTQMHQEAYHKICKELGENQFQQLSESEKELASFFIWTGCCMHKDLNTFKGGWTELVKHWSRNNLQGPVMLPNKDATATAAGDAEPAQPSQGGAVKAMSLAGGIFNHKDDKKGEQDSLQYAFEEQFGYFLNFPDISNTCYQSHREAAAELIAHLDFYKKYLELMMDRKEARSLNHMERNLQIALEDIPTLHELCVLALFAMIVSRPYMQVICGEGHENRNILDMGPFHSKVAAYMERITEDSMLILSPGADAQTASLDRKPWARADFMYAIWAMSLKLPHLKDLIVTFFKGALETWKRFTQEFTPGGVIATVSLCMKALAWMPTTNDVNEGALGSRRIAKRSFPKATELTLNSRQHYRWNRTGKFIRNLSPEQHLFLRKRARHLQSLNIQKNLRIARAVYDKEIVKQKHNQDAMKLEKKRKAADILTQVVPIISLEILSNSILTVAQLDLQLAWYHQFNGEIAKKSTLRLKTNKMDALRSIITTLIIRNDKDEIMAQYLPENGSGMVGCSEHEEKQR
ncbi:hypothetical protein M422DRAFT_262587 [Sphaerobolus stellatus SS14]|uniref:Uncharacterized protein n=1 Tax=Sphaerobolus stellatus (strain SS14) TaxID=990650 RepID=A0A0C9VCE9_SPHS4|nr:hypothetical protein M422DRAFT_262587 [Sphaerobolus stellatus SS14]